MKPWLSSLAALALLAALAPARAEPDAGALYQAKCAACHGGDRLGAIGPALKRALDMDEPVVVDVVTDIDVRAPEPWLP